MRHLPYWIGGFMLLPFMLWAGMFLAFPGDKPGITDSPLTAALVAVSLPLALFHYIAGLGFVANSMSGQADEVLPVWGPARWAQRAMAPLTVVLAWDWNFHEKIPQLFPHAPEAKDWFESDEARFENGFRNSTLQGAYLIMAARALGLDCGPMSGFHKDGVDEEFFKNDPEMGAWRSNFLINVGYGTTEKLFPRLPKLAFEQGAKLLK